MTFKRVSITHYGVWDGQRLRAETFVASVKSWPAGTPLKFTVDKYVEHKTLPQNSFLHVLFDTASRELNKEQMGDGSQWTPELVKQHCKDMKLYPVVDRLVPGGEIVQVTLDTHQLDKEQMSQTIERVIGYFGDWGIRLGRPGEQEAMKL